MYIEVYIYTCVYVYVYIYIYICMGVTSPPSQVLTLSRNPLTEINSAAGVLVNIKDMQLDGLALVVPPREIIVRGPGRIVEYMARVRRCVGCGV